MLEVAPKPGPFGDPPDKPQERGPMRWYITPHDERIQVEVCQRHNNGTFDIMIPAGMTSYRRDGVPKKTADRLTDCID